MAPISVNIKHAGKTFEIQLNPDLPPAVFKDAVYQVTGVPSDRMKVMIKGGVLKDDTDWKKVGPKAGQTFMVIGAAGELPKPPSSPVVFLEDMDDDELAAALAKPVGLTNLGNTCYMNATVQAMRAIPELQVALNASTLTSPLPLALRDLYANMSRTTETVTPTNFLSVLRQVVPQFAEFDRANGPLSIFAYAQQDADECWGQLTNALKEVPGISISPQEDVPATPAAKKFVEQYLTGEMRRLLKCDEAENEPSTMSTEKVLKIECNINASTNFMLSGILDALNQKVNKNSPSLGREAVYTQTSRLSRLPSYLTIHMVRFAWRRDINKKAKIMRRVKFPEELDALDIVTDDLKEKLLPVNRRLKEIEKDRSERRKVRKRTKDRPSGPEAESSKGESSVQGTTVSLGSTGEDSGSLTSLESQIPESLHRQRELAQLEDLVHPDLKADVGCSVNGLYELVAIVTHKGAYADAGHYISFVKKSVFHARPDAAQVSPSHIGGVIGDDDEDWYKFNDQDVSIFPREKLTTIDGGGEDSAAYVLLYRSRPLA